MLLKKKNLYKLIILILIILLIVVITYQQDDSDFNLDSKPIFNTDQNNSDDSNKAKEINQIETNQIDYENTINDLKEKYNNEEIVGILSFNDRDIMLPVAQTIDNEYYLHHAYDKSEDIKGAIYLDYRVSIDDSKKLLIYGHSSSKSEFPFNFLQNYHEEEYYTSNKNVDLITSTGIKHYEIFSVFVETSDFSYMNINFESDEDYLSHINKLKEKSMYDTDIKLEEDDEILIIQTCSTNEKYKDYENKYLLIILKRKE